MTDTQALELLVHYAYNHMLTKTESAVMLLMAAKCHPDTDICHIPIKRMAVDLNVSIESITKALAQLRKFSALVPVSLLQPDGTYITSYRVSIPTTEIKVTKAEKYRQARIARRLAERKKVIESRKRNVEERLRKEAIEDELLKQQRREARKLAK